jgi:hypothetical protein
LGFGRCNDLTVPYPTAMFTENDPFENHEYTDVRIEVDEDNIVRSWSFPNKQVRDKDGSVAYGETTRLLGMEESTERAIGEGIQGDRPDEPNVGVMVRKRSRIPPFFLLPLPFPFTYVSTLSRLVVVNE